MFRFTIRDVLWLTVVVAICSVWFVHVRSIRIAELRRSEEMLERAKSAYNETLEAIAKSRRGDVSLSATLNRP